LPKAGRSFVDCEDAYFPGELNNQQLHEVNHDRSDVFRASVSDGATDSIFSKLWAQLLAFGYGAGKWASEITAESVAEEQSAWLEFLAKQQLPWYAEEKAEMGAFAAMVGLTLLNDSKKWNAMAVGDCCIFHIRKGECIKSFPITSSAAFSNFPLLLCSVAERNSNVFDSKQVIGDGIWQSGDQFFLMSDTVACWFLTQIEIGNAGQTIAALESAQSLDAFVSIINHARTTKGADGNVLMRDDDVTVTIIRVADDVDPPLPKKFGSQVLTAATRPTAEIPKIAGKNAVDLPPIPVQRKTSSADSTASADLGGRGSVAAPPSATASGSAPSPQAHSASPYTSDATGNSGRVINQAADAKRSYAGRSRTKSNQPGLAIFVVGSIVVAAAAIGAATFFSHKSEKHLKTEQEANSMATPPGSKTDEASTKQSVNHHKSKHKIKKSHSVAGAPTASEHTSSQIPDTAPITAPSNSAPPNSIPPNSISPDSTSPQSPDSIPAQNFSPQSPQPAPDRNAAKPAGRPMRRMLDGMPPRAPDRNRMPLPAPDRTAGAPVQLPDHVRQDRGADRIRSSFGGGHQHHRSNSPAKPVGQQPDGAKPDKGRNDLPENLNY